MKLRNYKKILFGVLMVPIFLLNACGDSNSEPGDDFVAGSFSESQISGQSYAIYSESDLAVYWCKKTTSPSLNLANDGGERALQNLKQKTDDGYDIDCGDGDEDQAMTIQFSGNDSNSFVVYLRNEEIETGTWLFIEPNIVQTTVTATRYDRSTDIWQPIQYDKKDFWEIVEIDGNMIILNERSTESDSVQPEEIAVSDSGL